MRKKYKFSHGTRTGKDDIFLEKFIITGAVGTNWGHMNQVLGFHVTTNIELAKHYAGKQPSPDGSPMLIEIEAEIDGINWRLDNIQSKGSLMILRNMKDLFPTLFADRKSTGPYHFSPKVDVYFQDVHETPEGISISYCKSNDPDIRRTEQSWDRLMHPQLIDALLDILQKAAPERFAAENLKAMTVRGEYALRYLGKEPLKVDRISIYSASDGNFVQVYDRQRNPAATKAALRYAGQPARPPL